MRFPVWLLVVITLGSCTTSSQKKPNLYFDLESSVKVYTKELALEGKNLRKVAVVNGKSETVEYTPDSTGWSHELQFFSAASINTANNLNMYITSVRPDEGSNLTVVTYRHINEEEAKIPWMEIYYLENEENFLRLNLEYREANKGFSAERDLSLEMENIGGRSVLKSYSIEGYQKILGQDSVLFKVRGEVY